MLLCTLQHWFLSKPILFLYFFFACFLIYYIDFHNNRCCVVYVNIDFLKTDVNVDKINIGNFNIDFLTDVVSKKQLMLKAYFLIGRTETNQFLSFNLHQGTTKF